MVRSRIHKHNRLLLMLNYQRRPIKTSLLLGGKEACGFKSLYMVLRSRQVFFNWGGGGRGVGLAWLAETGKKLGMVGAIYLLGFRNNVCM